MLKKHAPPDRGCSGISAATVSIVIAVEGKTQPRGFSTKAPVSPRIGREFGNRARRSETDMEVSILSSPFRINVFASISPPQNTLVLDSGGNLISRSDSPARIDSAAALPRKSPPARLAGSQCRREEFKRDRAHQSFKTEVRFPPVLLRCSSGRSGQSPAVRLPGTLTP